jgi:hypothetical protein
LIWLGRLRLLLRYALYGQPGAPLEMPAAYQVAAPFGSNIGPVNAAFLPIFPDAAFDSWLTIGTTGPALIPGALSMVGLPLDDWSEDVGFCADNGAVGNARQLLLLLHLLSLLLSRTPLPLRLRVGR